MRQIRHSFPVVRLFAVMLMLAFAFVAAPRASGQELETDLGEELEVTIHLGGCDTTPESEEEFFEVDEAELITFEASAFEDIEDIDDLDDDEDEDEDDEEDDEEDEEDFFGDEDEGDDPEEVVDEDEDDEDDEDVEDVDVGLTEEDGDDEDDLDVVVGQQNAVWAFGEELDLDIEDLLEEEFAIAVHAPSETIGQVLACGEFGGAVTEEQVVIPLLAQGDSGVFGVVAIQQGSQDDEIVLLGYVFSAFEVATAEDEGTPPA
jgi:hypothetical protein